MSSGEGETSGNMGGFERASDDFTNRMTSEGLSACSAYRASTDALTSPLLHGRGEVLRCGGGLSGDDAVESTERGVIHDGRAAGSRITLQGPDYGLLCTRDLLRYLSCGEM